MMKYQCNIYQGALETWIERQLQIWWWWSISNLILSSVLPSFLQQMHRPLSFLSFVSFCNNNREISTDFSRSGRCNLRVMQIPLCTAPVLFMAHFHMRQHSWDWESLWGGEGREKCTSAFNEISVGLSAFTLQSIYSPEFNSAAFDSLEILIICCKVKTRV